MQQTLRHLTDVEVAAELGVSVRTVRGWRMRGGGPKYRRIGRSVRYPVSELERWLEERTRESTSDPGPEPDHAA